MKTIDQVLADIQRRLANTWPQSTTIAPAELPSRAADQDQDPAAAWPHAFALGKPASAQLADNFAAAAAWAATWRSWSAGHDVALRTASRRVHGTDQALPTHVIVMHADQAAHLVGGAWPHRLEQGRRRASILAADFPHLAAPTLLAPTVAAVDTLDDVDFDLLRRAATWFRTNDATGLTPRQVPIEGLHAKWLNHRHHLVRRLSGSDDLRLLPPHPPRVHFTYLDPTHRGAGGRHHDSATLGDAIVPAYQPEVVIISENKDTAIHFPELDAGISIEGVGRGGTTIAGLPWLTHADHVIYWGDMDADGLEILNEFRAAGIPATSILMVPSAYERWEKYGTNLDARGRPLQARTPRPVPLLTAAETELYLNLIAEDWTGHRRVEQERIPLAVAASAVRHLITAVRAG
ncbi:DUF2220 family protein [Amorphoplanes nipponensis]|uniref:Wadjet protein JetD C-terminal domain-containing protein n=1 Tax=Actinoplanes nipponensis TaxID=135950 RepID=A0A919JLL6_9ACTN|nr:DUF3322 and DUF2220 domain-containing protein [Actinoplanes nipponensis]GIE51595.1 hypothetical protein Ani05nite_51290 [Actinoplanes nipponensis]